MKEIDFSQLPSGLYADVSEALESHFKDSDANINSIQFLSKTGLIIFNNINSRTLHELGRIDYVIHNTLRESIKADSDMYDRSLKEYFDMIQIRDIGQNHKF